MTTAVDELAEARTLLAAGDEGKALQHLHAAVDTTDDPDLLREIHDLAVSAHESSHGFHKIEWNRLVLETER